MAWIPDEQWVLQQDTRNKKITARSARSTRTHCGRRGAVKFASDYMSAKELKKMNGPVESFKMNDPMTWEEFKKLPDDLKVVYIKALREKYNVPNNALAEMFGISAPVITRYFKCYGLAEGRGTAQSKRIWDKEGFYAWRSGASASTVEHHEVPVEEAVIESDIIDDERDIIVETEYTPAGCDSDLYSIKLGSSEPKTLVPVSGEMTFEGHIDGILQTIESLLKDSRVKFTVEWEVIE